MFKIFEIFGSSKTKEIRKMLQVGLANAVLSAGEQASSGDAMLVEVASTLTKNWLKTLPAEATDNCQPSVLAAYILVAESQVSIGNGNQINANLYIDAAKLLVDGIGFRMAAGTVHDAEITLLTIMAKIAKKNGLDFYSEILEITG